MRSTLPLAPPSPGSSAFRALAGRRVLVTGPRGFIGRHLVHHLLDVGAEVHGLVRPGTGPHPPAGYRTSSGPRGRVTCAARRVRWHEALLTDAEAVGLAVDAAEPDVVIHLGGRVEGTRDPSLVASMIEQNTQATVTLMAAAVRRPGCRVVLAGSVEEPRRIDEAPCSPYAAAKASATACARLFHDQWGLPVTVLRVAMGYGPDQPDVRKLVPHVVTHLLAGEVPPISSGARHIDWVYVDDVCEAFALAAARTEVDCLVADVGSGVGVSIADTVALLADRAAAITGRRVPVGTGAVGDRHNDTARIADTTTASEVLGWRARTRLVDGLARTLHWYHRYGPTAAHDSPPLRSVRR